jgi:hypothetical protein
MKKRTDQERLLWLQSQGENTLQRIIKNSGQTISNFIISNRSEIDLLIEAPQNPTEKEKIMLNNIIQHLVDQKKK